MTGPRASVGSARPATPIWSQRSEWVSLSRYMTAPTTNGPIASAMSVSPQPVAPDGGVSVEEPSTSHTRRDVRDHAADVAGARFLSV
jgi:hypothetical protein